MAVIWGDKHVRDALWWVERWVSGSMDDPEWSYPECSVGFDEAFDVVRRAAPCSLPPDTVLWRYLVLDKAGLRRLREGMLLEPQDVRFQSFTTSAGLAAEIGPEIRAPRRGEVGVVVGAEVPPGQVMFAMRDLYETFGMDALDLWEGQDEVVVEVAAPLPLLAVHTLDEVVEFGSGAPRL